MKTALTKPPTVFLSILNDIAGFVFKVLLSVHRLKAMRSLSGPLLHRTHRIRLRLGMRRYRARFPGIEIVHYGRAALAAQHALGYRSQAGQDYYIHQTFFCTRTTPGTYVDVGANDPVCFSNTYYFDRHLHWQGIALEPLKKYRESWASLRSADFIACVASDSEGELEFDEVADQSVHGDALSAVSGDSGKYQGFNAIRRHVAARPLSAILQERGITHVDFMSIDVEGHEMSVLRGMDFAHIPADILLIENNEPPIWGNDAIRAHMQKNGFFHYARIWHMDDVFVRKAWRQATAGPVLKASRG
jgi:FkbM family methyltransferase